MDDLEIDDINISSGESLELSTCSNVSVIGIEKPIACEKIVVFIDVEAVNVVLLKPTIFHKSIQSDIGISGLKKILRRHNLEAYDNYENPNGYMIWKCALFKKKVCKRSSLLHLKLV